MSPAHPRNLNHRCIRVDYTVSGISIY
jgi:hypothetical protein